VTARSRAARAAASLVLAGALVVGTAGCTFISTQATLIQYDPGEGVGTRVGDVDIRNALLLPSEDGHALSLVVTLINTGSSGAKVAFQYETGGQKSDVSAIVRAGQTLSFGATTEQKQLVLLTTEGTPGSLLPIYVQYGDNEGKLLLVPVLSAEAAEYDGLRPPEILR
jgi:hypothetical protein